MGRKKETDTTLRIEEYVLTDKQARFAEEYLTDLNGTQAYIRAGYKARGKSAEVNACRLLSNAKVQAYIQYLKSKRSDRTEVTQDRVVKELARIAFANMGRYARFNTDGVKLKDSEEMTEDELAAVSEVSETVTKEGGTVRFKLHDKKGALESLAKHTGVYKDPTVNVKLEDNRTRDFTAKEREILKNAAAEIAAAEIAKVKAEYGTGG